MAFLPILALVVFCGAVAEPSTRISQKDAWDARDVSHGIARAKKRHRLGDRKESVASQLISIVAIGMILISVYILTMPLLSAGTSLFSITLPSKRHMIFGAAYLVAWSVHSNGIGASTDSQRVVLLCLTYVCKVFFTVCMMAFNQLGKRKDTRMRGGNHTACSRVSFHASYAFVALLYTMYDGVIFLLLGAHVNAISFAVTMSLRPVLVCALNQLLRHQHFSSSQRIAVASMTVAGCALAFHKASSQAASLHSVGLAIFLLCIGSVAPVVNEKLLKEREESMLVQNLSLYLWSVVFLSVGVAVSGQPLSAIESLAPATVVAVLVSATFGLMTSFFLLEIGSMAREMYRGVQFGVAAALGWFTPVHGTFAFTHEAETLVLIALAGVLYSDVLGAARMQVWLDAQYEEMQSEVSLEPITNTDAARVIYTLGCYDAFHCGHQVELEHMHARSAGHEDCELIVGLYDDLSILQLTGKAPVDPLDVRMMNVKRYCDQVFVVDDTDPSLTFATMIDLSEVASTVYMLGKYTPDFPGRQVLEELGIKIEYLDYADTNRRGTQESVQGRASATFF